MSSVIHLFLLRFAFTNSTSLAAFCRQSLKSFHFLSICSLLFSNSFGYRSGSSIHQMLNLFLAAILYLILYSSCFSTLMSNSCCLGAALALLSLTFIFMKTGLRSELMSAPGNILAFLYCF